MKTNKDAKRSINNLCFPIKDYDRILFLAMGGGGDIAMAATLALAHERCGGESVIGSIAWERYVVDPIPGPIRLEEFFDVVEKSEGYVVVNQNTYAIRGKRKIIPQAVNVANILNREVVIFDIYRGSTGLAEVLNNFKILHSVDAVIGVDVGGDVVAEGFEENLWSPLADAVVAAALAHLDNTYIAIASPGADGELPLDHIEKRIRRIIRLGGYIGGYMLSAKDIEVLRSILRNVVSEASTIPLKVVDTDLDVIDIRGGSRSVKLSLLNLAVIILDAVTIVRDSIAKYIFKTKNLEEARQILNRLSIVTEYDIEEEVYREQIERGSQAEIDLISIRNRLREKLARSHIDIDKVKASN